MHTCQKGSKRSPAFLGTKLSALFCRYNPSHFTTNEPCKKSKPNRFLCPTKKQSGPSHTMSRNGMEGARGFSHVCWNHAAVMRLGLTRRLQSSFYHVSKDAWAVPGQKNWVKNTSLHPALICLIHFKQDAPATLKL